MGRDLFDGHFHQFLQASVEDVEVDIALDAVELSGIGMLPEFPRTGIFELAHVVVGYPEGICIEEWVVEVTNFEFIGCVDDGLYAVVLLHTQQPGACSILKGLVSFSAEDFDVEYGWEVSGAQFYVGDEEFGLFFSRYIGAEEVVCSSYHSAFASGSEVVLKSVVNEVDSFGCFHEYEVDRPFFVNSKAQARPIDGSLVVRNVQSVYVWTEEVYFYLFFSFGIWA